MVLFALGLAISSWATFEGRRADAPYPGFSDAARQFERSRRDVQDALDEYYDSFDDIVERAASTQGGPLDSKQKMAIRKEMDDAAMPFKLLLTTDGDVLRDEFQVSSDIVTRITNKESDPMPNPHRNTDYETEGET